MVAGIRTPQEITEAARKESGSDKPSMENAMPEAYAELVRIYAQLEKHYRDMQDIEFTVEEGKLWMLQTRTGKRTAKAALRIAVEMANERADHARRGGDAHRSGCARSAAASDPRSESRAQDHRDRPAGVARRRVGEIVFSADEAEALKAQGKKVILVRVETSPEDIHGMHAAEGILTTRGGMTSHAAVVARGMGKPCVSGAGTLRVDYAAQTMTAAGQTFKKGDDHHHRRLDRPGARRPRADDGAGTVRRVRHADGLGRQVRTLEGARQRRHAARRARRAEVRRRGHRALPHRAHVLRGRPHPARCAR